MCLGAAAVATRAPPVDGPRLDTRHSLEIRSVAPGELTPLWRTT